MLLLRIPSGPTVADVRFSQEKAFLPFLLTRRNFPSQTEQQNLKTPGGNKNIFLMWYIYAHRQVACLSNVICHTQMQSLKVITVYFQQCLNSSCFNISIMIPFSEMFFKKMKLTSAWLGCMWHLTNRGLWATLRCHPAAEVVWQCCKGRAGRQEEKLRQEKVRRWSEELKGEKDVKLNKTGNYWSNSQMRKNISSSSVTDKGEQRNTE